MKLQPTQNYVLIRIHDQARDSSIILPEGTQFKPYGEVVAFGPDVTADIDAGDKVHFIPSALIGYDETEKLCFIAEPSILAIYE